MISYRERPLHGVVEELRSYLFGDEARRAIVIHR
jgi:hypothetical protein